MSEVKYSLLVKIFYFDPSGAMCQSGPCTLVAECLPGTSDSLWNFTPLVRKVSPQDFLPILGAPRPKISNRFFWPACDQMVLLTDVRPKPGFGPFVVRLQVTFSKFWLLENFGPLRQWSRKFSSGIFYLFWAPHGQKLRIGLFNRRETKWCFWPACDQNQGSVLLTIVRLFPCLCTFDQ